MVAPNGGRLTKADHPALPMSLDEIVEAARSCFEAGADGLHLHLRDSHGAHVLDAGRYREALGELTRHVPNMHLQITTEALGGRYTPQAQMDVALGSGARFVSIAVRELQPDITPEAAARFYAQCADQSIAVQHILYAVEDMALLACALPQEALHDGSTQLLYVLGRYTAGQESDPSQLIPYLDYATRHDWHADWMVCAFGRGETACLMAAHGAGGKLRVGFENARVHSDGRVAASNAERVAAIVDCITMRDRSA